MSKIVGMQAYLACTALITFVLLLSLWSTCLRATWNIVGATMVAVLLGWCIWPLVIWLLVRQHWRRH